MLTECQPVANLTGPICAHGPIEHFGHEMIYSLDDAARKTAAAASGQGLRGSTSVNSSQRIWLPWSRPGCLSDVCGNYPRKEPSRERRNKADRGDAGGFFAAQSEAIDGLKVAEGYESISV